MEENNERSLYQKRNSDQEMATYLISMLVKFEVLDEHPYGFNRRLIDIFGKIRWNSLYR